MAFDKVKFLAAVTALKEAVFATEKFKDAKLIDGTTIIRYDAEKLDIGVPVMAVTESGAIAIPDGDYELEDGTKFTIAEGVVSAVTPMEEVEAEPSAEPASAPVAQTQNPATPMNEKTAKAIVESIIKETRFAEEIAELKAQVSEFTKVKENFAAQENEASTKIAELTEKVKKSEETMLQLFSLVETIGAEDSAVATEKSSVAAPKVTVKKKTMKELKAEFKSILK